MTIDGIQSSTIIYKYKYKMFHHYSSKKINTLYNIDLGTSSNPNDWKNIYINHAMSKEDEVVYGTKISGITYRYLYEIEKCLLNFVINMERIVICMIGLI